MHGLVQPQIHLPIFRSVFVYTSSRVVFEALDRRCDGHRGLPHAVLTSESVRHVSFLPKQLVDRLMLRLLRDANAPPEMITAARNFHCPHCDLMARRTGTWPHHFH